MRVISRLERAGVLDKLVAPGQRIARLLPPGRLRDCLHGVWLGHPLHPVLVQPGGGMAVAGYGSSLACRSARLGRLLRLCGLAVLAAGGVLGGHLSFRLAGGANHAEAVPHLVQPAGIT